MAVEDILKTFRDRESPEDALKARWYIVAAAALAAASAGEKVTDLYKLVIQGLSLDDQKIVQRRIKEAILKTSCLYGVPRSLHALFPLYASLKEEEIDTYSPRWDTKDSPEAAKIREEKARKHFDTLWSPEAGEQNRQALVKYHADLYLLNLKHIYKMHISEDAILSSVEGQMCNAAALVCSKSPTQAMWHTRGIVRHGGIKDDARFAVDLGLAIAGLYECDVKGVVPVHEVDFGDSEAVAL